MTESQEFILSKWAKVLRSGKYIQGHTYLRKTGNDSVTRYCCLGVLCDMYMEEFGGEWSEPGTDMVYRFLGSCAYPPPAVVKWAGLDYERGFQNPDEYSTIDFTNLNDYGAKTFQEIADVIEQEITRRKGMREELA